MLRRQLYAKKEGEKIFILELLDVYKSLPALWKINSKEYNDKRTKERQYEVLLGKFREKYPDAEQADVNKKINILRSNFRRELKRLNELRKSSDISEGEEFVFESKLWYFDAISFISDINRKEIVSKRSKYWREKTNCVEEAVCTNATYAESMNESQTVDNQENKVNKEPQPKKIKREHTAANKMLVSDPDKRVGSQDAFKKASEVWTIKLQEMDRTQALIAEKLINEILFNGQMGQLNFNSALNLNFLSDSRSTTPQNPLEEYEEFSMDE